MALDEEDLPRLVATLAVTLRVHDIVELRAGVDIGLEPAATDDRLGDRTGRLPRRDDDGGAAPLVERLARSRAVPLARAIVRLGEGVDVTERDRERFACRLRNRGREGDVEVTLRERSLDGRLVDYPDAVLGLRRVRRRLGCAGTRDEPEHADDDGHSGCGQSRGAESHSSSLFSY